LAENLLGSGSGSGTGSGTASDPDVFESRIRIRSKFVRIRNTAVKSGVKEKGCGSGSDSYPSAYAAQIQKCSHYDVAPTSENKNYAALDPQHFTCRWKKNCIKTMMNKKNSGTILTNCTNLTKPTRL
jgi:hypothetical protein